VYARLQRGSDDIPTCYLPEDISRWADRFRAYASGAVPDDLPRVAPERKAAGIPRDIYAFFITGGKVNAPRGAKELQHLV
ncbi:MAG: DUF72 domain-containing protein, partial [Hoeflea sp.]|nr:DUF72 domain-containing protein [Hoeflea sp.]